MWASAILCTLLACGPVRADDAKNGDTAAKEIPTTATAKAASTDKADASKTAAPDYREEIEELREVIGRARAGKLRTGEIEGGSFTVSNLGMFGIDQFDAIINPPQGAILAIGAASPRPIERGGGLSIATTAQVSLSCDHRAIDGAVGARFLAALRNLIEAPQGL